MEIIVNTNKKIEFMNITEKIEHLISSFDIKSGASICMVYIPHTTAAIMTNE